MHRDRKRGQWRVQRTVNGQRISQYFSSKTEAERYEYELTHGLVKAARKREDLTFGDYATKWHADYCKVHKAPSQWRRDLSDLNRHLVPAIGPIKLRNLTKAHLLELQVTLRKKPGRGGEKLSAKTVNNVVNLAKGMLGTAVEWDYLKENPWGSVKPLKVAELDYDWWTIDEFEAFEAKARELNPLLTRIATVAFHTGLRPGELAALRTRDLDWMMGQIVVKATRCLTTGERQEATKGKRIRRLDMNQAVKAALEPSRFSHNPEASVFPMEPFWSLCKRFRRLCKAVEAREIRFYDLRHSFASNLSRAGVDLMVIQKLMGHQSYQMTLRYAHIHPSRTQSVTDVLCTSARKLHANGGVT